MTSDYQPIACGLYDQIELLLMRGGEIVLLRKDGAVLLVKNPSLIIQNGAENLCFDSENGQMCVRLDQIAQLKSEFAEVNLSN